MKHGIIFDIQHYALYDGPGIRTTVFLKGCPLTCQWCHNPESQKLKPTIAYLKDKCTACGKCVEVCPEKALQMNKDKVKKDFQQCTACGKCLEVCVNDAIEQIGKEMSVEEVVYAVEQDRPFYENSGGGVTLTGGEPTLQFDFLIDLLKALKKQNIHRALETCGYFKEDKIPSLIELVDLFLYDIKHVDDTIHKEFTGVSNTSILKNFELIYKQKGNHGILARIPLIPNFNSDRESISKIVDFLQSIGYNGEVHIMPYNTMYKTKYEKIGKAEDYHYMGNQSEEDLQTIIQLVEEKHFQVVCNH